MATLTLGTISPGKTSLFSVGATSKQDNVLFTYKFKKGKSKGENCQCKKIHKEGLCKFHHRKYVQSMEKKKQQLEKVNPNIKIKTVKFNKNQNLVITI